MEKEFSGLNLNAPADTTERICTDVVDCIGHTPLVQLNNISKGLDAKIGNYLNF